MDFGRDHPFAAVELVWDRDTDTAYVSKTYRIRQAPPTGFLQTTANPSDVVVGGSLITPAPITFGDFTFLVNYAVTADDAQVYFPKWGLATGRKEFETLFADLGNILTSIRHDYAYFNYIIQGDHVVVEGTSYGKTKNGTEWRAGVTHAGRWCDVFEIRDFRIQRVFIYLDPDYTGEDAARFRWGRNRRW